MSARKHHPARQGGEKRPKPKPPPQPGQPRTAVITGITGQDGSYLAELLLEKGYRVVGMLRRLSLENYARIEHLAEQVELVQGDLLDGVSLATILHEYQPDEVYNLAAMRFVH